MPAHAARLSWNADRTQLSVAPERRWRNDEAYLVVVGASATTADGAALATPRQFAFSTQTAPVVSDFAVELAGVDLQEAAPAETAVAALRLEQNVSEARTLSPDETARDVSPVGSIRIGFTGPMSHAAVEERFTISPAVAGDLSWSGRDLIFTPSERLQPGGRYTISLAGAHDRTGNELGGKTNFTFLVRAAPEVIHTTPSLGALDVEPATVEMWFSQPMNVDATNAAFSLTDTTTGRLVGGNLDWNEAGTQLVMTPNRAFAGGRTFEVTLGAGAADAAGNPIVAGWSFTTKEGPPPATPAARAAAAARGEAPQAIAFVPGPASGLEGYGINQINSARAAYGLGPLYLDPGMSAVASAHAWDQLELRLLQPLWARRVVGPHPPGGGWNRVQRGGREPVPREHGHGGAGHHGLVPRGLHVGAVAGLLEPHRQHPELAVHARRDRSGRQRVARRRHLGLRQLTGRRGAATSGLTAVAGCSARRDGRFERPGLAGARC